SAWQYNAGSERREPRIDEYDTWAKRSCRAGATRRQVESGERVVAKHCGHCKLGSLVERDLGAQPIDREPSPQIAKSARFRVEPQRFANLDQNKVVQIFTLRSEKRGVPRGIPPDLVDVI